MPRPLIWILSILCALLFVFVVRWAPAHGGVAIVLNLLLALFCFGLLMAVKATGEPKIRPGISSTTARNIIVLGLVLIYLAMSLAKFNGSSTALWRQYADRETPAAGLIAGTAKKIRMDEWLVQTPWIWSQTNQSPPFPVTNRNIGNGVAPLLTNLPVAHWTVLFRPQMWGFFVLDRERAFAFNWNFKWLGLLLGGFLFFRVVARGNNSLALAGALILFFSSYVQWFFSSPTCLPEIVSMLFIGLWALDLIFRAKSRWAVAGGALALLVALEQFVFCSYPRFQIPLIYLALVLIGAAWFEYRNPGNSLHAGSNRWRAIVFFSVLVIAAAFFWRWQREVGVSIREIQSLAYPGQVFSTGGAYPWYFLAAPFLEFSMREDHFPAGFANVCEASGFLFIAPILAAALFRDLWHRRVDAIWLGLILFLAGLIVFLLCGVPLWLARATGWIYVTSARAVLPLVVASVAGLVRYLSGPAGAEADRDRFFWVIPLLLGPILFGCFYAANLHLEHFATLAELTAAALFFATLFSLLWRRLPLVSCLLLLVPSLCAYGLVNPIGRGLPGLTQSGMFQWLAQFHAGDEGALWLVTGDLTERTCFLPQLVAATGAHVLGGTRSMPDREMLAALDPEDRYRSVHDRFARVCFQASAEAPPVFELYDPAYYVVRLPFQTEWFDRLKVRYVLLVDSPNQGAILPGFERMGEREGCVLWRRATGFR